MLIEDIAKMLAAKVHHVVPMLLPAAKLRNGVYYVGSIQGEKGGSLKIETDGATSGFWYEHNPSGQIDRQGGDLVELWRIVRGLNKPDAIFEIKQYLGVSDGRIAPISRDRWLPAPDSNSTFVVTGSNNRKVLSYLCNERKLTLDTLATFSISSLNDQEIVFPFFDDGVLVNRKYRPISHKTFQFEKGCKQVMFGWHVAKSEGDLLITEGEFDAMSAYQMLNGEVLSVLSVPSGSSIGNKCEWLANDFEKLEAFDRIYLCMDMDIAGQKGNVALAERLGKDRCFIVQLPYKDLNECLQNDMTGDELREYIKKAKVVGKQRILEPTDLREEVLDDYFGIDKLKEGYYLPFVDPEHKIVFSPNMLSVWTGINGHGKSQFLGFLMAHHIQQGARVLALSFEVQPKKFVGSMIKQVITKNEKTISTSEIDLALEFLSGGLWIYNHDGHINIKNLINLFRYAVKRYGINVFLIDSLMRCIDREDDYASQADFIAKLCSFKMETNCQIHLVAHARKKQMEAQSLDKMDIKGSGAITDQADYVFVIERNKDKELLNKERVHHLSCVSAPDATVSCVKNRPNGHEEEYRFWFDPENLCFFGDAYRRPEPMIDLSLADHSINAKFGK